MSSRRRKALISNLEGQPAVRIFRILVAFVATLGFFQALAAEDTSQTSAFRAGADVQTKTSVPALEDSSEMAELPRLLTQVPPRYPVALRASRAEGFALVDFVIDTGGVVRRARAVASNNPLFSSAAVDAVNQWHFAPGKKFGRAVNTYMIVPRLTSPGRVASRCSNSSLVSISGARKSHVSASVQIALSGSARVRHHRSPRASGPCPAAR